MNKLILSALVAATLLSGCCCKQSANLTADQNPVIENILSRRSIRAYQERPVNRDTMDLILKCGINAPSGMNRQPWEIRVTDNPEFINGTTRLYVEQMKDDPRWSSMISDPSFKNMYRNAPTVVFIATPTDRPSGLDCGLMIENMLLAANALGVGSCCLGGPVNFLKSDIVAPYYDRLGFSEDMELILAIAFGYPAEAPDAKPRDASKVAWVD